jgi:hypothetical protein
MPLSNAATTYIAQAIGGESITYFDNTHAYLGVGDSTTAFAGSQTDLQAATNKFRRIMDATYPQRSANVITYRVTFGGTEANFAWQEFGLFNASSGGTMFNRKVSAQGTKTSGQLWELTLVNTINNP